MIKGVLSKLGAKKIAIILIGIIAVVSIGVVTVVGLNKGEEELQESIQTEEEEADEVVVEEEEPVVELQEWQEDYARVLLETLYIPLADFYDDTPWDEEGNPKGDLEDFFRYAVDTDMYFGLLDVNGDDIPELFVSPDKSYINDNKYMFSVGDTIEECYQGRMYYVDTELNEIVRVCYGNHAGKYVVYTFDGNELVEQFVLGTNDVENRQIIYERYTSDAYEQREQISKEEYEELYAKYNQAEKFPMEMKELTLENILTGLNVSVSAQDKKLLESIQKVCFEYLETQSGEAGIPWEGGMLEHKINISTIDYNEDDLADYVFFDGGCYWLVVSSEEQYYIYDLMIENDSVGYFHVEGKERIIQTGVWEGEYTKVYEMNDEHELECVYSLNTDLLKDNTGQYVTDSNGEFIVVYEVYENNETSELSENEYNAMYDELWSKQIESIEDYTYIRPSTVLESVSITLAEE